MHLASPLYGNSHVPYRSTQCYLPPGRGDFPAFTPTNYSWYLIQRPQTEGCKAELT